MTNQFEPSSWNGLNSFGNSPATKFSKDEPRQDAQKFAFKRLKSTFIIFKSTTSWIGWLLAGCVCLSALPGTEARYKLRRPPPPPAMFKKSWPISHRVSMGNTMHINSFPPKRMAHKPPNYRVRRPPVFNVLPTSWKTQAVHPPMNNRAVLPKRPPVKEFHSMSNVPEYSPEYRPETAVLPPTHRGEMDEDRGPIHTIPAPNLSPADKPYNLVESSGNESPGEQIPQRTLDYNSNAPGTLATNFAFGTAGTSVSPQRTVTSPTPTQTHYEVTETNEIGPKDYRTVQPTFFTPEFHMSQLSTIVNPDLQTNELYMSHPPMPPTGLIGSNMQFGQQNMPMQTNLHSSLHVGFPGTGAGQVPLSIGHQIPDLHVGHPASAGPPLSATQLYDLLNSFPQQLTEQYTAGQQPQLQQHLLQQQLGQFFQQQPGGVTSFSQPQMHSFNYDEQANKEQRLQQQQLQQQQQQVLLGQNYASGKVTADYNLEPEPTDEVRSNVVRQNEVVFPDSADQLENNIEYDEASGQGGQSAYFGNIGKDGVAPQFYTTLPNREAAEKLAALAAAGNVNSQLIGQLRKQQNQQSEESMPFNHKDEGYSVNEQPLEQEKDSYDHRQHYVQQQQQKQFQHQMNQEQNERYQSQYAQQQQQQQRPEQEQPPQNGEKRPLRIMVPDIEEYADNAEGQPSRGNENEEYEYEEEDPENMDQTNSQADDRRTYQQSASAEFGTRLNTKTG
ncbi:transcription factor SPT20 homolog [Orussus abietinus]|uniref:transcription factor SPT20 homolog n=1 Tax=Orussus abietinus TaxID=222816 RepID=UPI000C715FDA|nr:transcription factor SPT20 homolog [Orussus abietinus]